MTLDASGSTATVPAMKARDWVEDIILLRYRRGWSRADLAKRLKVKPRRLRSWEDRTRSPDPIVRQHVERFIRENANGKEA
jgi:ribosome-binding protein aMBF1 (putative translation factor)